MEVFFLSVCRLEIFAGFVFFLYNREEMERKNFTTQQLIEWTNDDALELIEQYRSHTELWNRADPKYKDKLCRFRAWSEIAEHFGCSKAEVERKMNVLLTQYRREKHKMLMKLYEGIQPGPSKWYAFKRFDFMEGGSAAILAAAAVAAQHHRQHQHSSNGIDNATVSRTIFDELPSSSSHTHSRRKIKNREMKYFGAVS